MLRCNPILSAIGAMALAIATNALIFHLGWRQPEGHNQPPWAPPGFVIGIVWTVLFGCMGAARCTAFRSGDVKGKRLIEILILLCLAYPFYTAGFQDGVTGLAGTLVTFAYTAFVAWRARKRSCRSGVLLLPLLAWLVFAAALILEVQRLNA